MASQAYTYRQPGAIKQTITTPLLKQNHALTDNRAQRQFDQHHEKSSISINYSSRNLKHFPKQFGQIDIGLINILTVDDNLIRQCTLDTQAYTNLQSLSVQRNKMQKFNIKRSFNQAVFSRLHTLNVSNNCLQFVDLTSLPFLVRVVLSHNCISTVLLPPQHLQSLDISYNQFSNIQYSVLSGKVFQKMVILDVSHNQRALYDLVLTVKGENEEEDSPAQLLPNLTQLNCGFNVLSYIQCLPSSLEHLNMECNQFIFDRRSISEVIKLKKLKQLNISGSSINQNFLRIIVQKLPNTNITLKTKQQALFKQSPYRIHDEVHPRINAMAYQEHETPEISLSLQQYDKHKHSKNKHRGSFFQTSSSYLENLHKNETRNIIYSNFTLGDDHGMHGEFQIIDPDYKIFYQQQQQISQIPLKETTNSPIKLPIMPIYNEQDGKKALKQVQNSLRPQKFKLKIEGTRFHNHYKFYFQKLQQFMVVPPRPIRHRETSQYISVRIDPCQQRDKQIVGEFELLNEMFNNRGGLHYVRKVCNWQATRTLGAHIPIMFINSQLNKRQFQQLCEGNYEQVDYLLLQKHALNQQPCSFTCYHILARIDPTRSPIAWSCLYLLEAAHL